MSQRLSLEDALEVAMEAELKAQAFYARAAIQVDDTRGRDLLSRLAAFEQYHYQKLSELARSLQQEGQYIEYQGRAMEHFAPLAEGGETSGTEVDELKDEVAILSKAIENETIAGERYRLLAEETDDPAGQEMFKSLEREEEMHRRILEDEFFALSNQGVWGWSGLYGE